MTGGKPTPEVTIEFALAYARLQDHQLPAQQNERCPAGRRTFRDTLWGPLDEAVLRCLQKEIVRLRQLLQERPNP